MDRRRFLRKLIQPQAGGDSFTLQVQTIPYLAKALRKDPETLQYAGSDDSTTYLFTFHLEKRQENRPSGALIISIELNSNRGTGEINLTELIPGRSPLRECLSEASRFSIDDHHITFYQPGLSASVSSDYSLRLSRP